MAHVFTVHQISLRYWDLIPWVFPKLERVFHGLELWRKFAGNWNSTLLWFQPQTAKEVIGRRGQGILLVFAKEVKGCSKRGQGMSWARGILQAFDYSKRGQRTPWARDKFQVKFNVNHTINHKVPGQQTSNISGVVREYIHMSNRRAFKQVSIFALLIEK